MIDIQNYIQGKRKKTSSGWISFNAPCCIHRGETQDRRQRGGLKYSSDTDWSYHCFNCGYTAGFKLGYPVGIKAKNLMKWMGVPEIEIQRLNIESLKNKSIDVILDERKVETKVDFADVGIPGHIRPMDPRDSLLETYLWSRGINPKSYPFMVDEDQKRKGIVIPYTYQDKIVGRTTRFLDDRKPKYLNEQPQGYVFGVDLQQEDWQIAIVCEGVFDAISINGLAVLHNDINDKQAALIRSLHKEVIVVPDMDKAGITLIDKAVKLGFSVSIPNWDDDVKDINDAVQKYGKLATIVSIIKSKTTNKIKIRMARDKIKKRHKEIVK